MKRFIDNETKTIWYYLESDYPTYQAITSFRKRNPSSTHSIASKETWRLKKNEPLLFEGRRS